MNWLTRLYPRAWRERYGAEFDALLEDAPATWRDTADILVEACKVHLTTGRSVLILSAAGLLLGAAFTFTAPQRYVSSTVVRVVSEPGAEDESEAVVTELLSRGSLAEIIQRPSLDLYKGERSRLPMEDIIQGEMRRNIRISSSKSGEMTVSFAYLDAKKAQLTTEALAERLRSEFAARGRERSFLWREAWPQDPAPPKQIAEVVSPPTVSETVGDRRWSFLAAGALVGMLAAFCWRRPTLAGFAAAGALVLTAASFVIPDRYTSSAVVRITPPLAPHRLWNELAPEAAAASFDRTLEAVRAADNLPIVAAQARVELTALQRDLRVSAAGREAFRVAFTYPDRIKAQQVVRRIVTELTEKHIIRQRDSGMQAYAFERKLGPRLEVLDPASLPELPVFPNRLAIAGLGAPFGLLAGIFVLRRRTVIRAQ